MAEHMDLSAPQRPLPDNGNEIGVLRRREIEARIVAPLLDALGAEFGREAVLRVARETIIRIAREQGAQLAGHVGGDSLPAFEQTLPAWTKDDALRIEVVERDGVRRERRVGVGAHRAMAKQKLQRLTPGGRVGCSVGAIALAQQVGQW